MAKLETLAHILTALSFPAGMRSVTMADTSGAMTQTMLSQGMPWGEEEKVSIEVGSPNVAIPDEETSQEEQAPQEDHEIILDAACLEPLEALARLVRDDADEVHRTVHEVAVYPRTDLTPGAPKLPYIVHDGVDEPGAIDL